MTSLNPSTLRRLLELPQIPSVWEGDLRGLLPGTVPDSEWPEEPSRAEGQCILWVDGSQGMVRAMDVVATETGHEAIVRTLLRAMEHPHNPAMPARPQKIVVRDREVLFYLRGVLQDLEIALDYVPDLPLIDEIFRGFQEASNARPPVLPAAYAEELLHRADVLWQDAPWELLADHQILEVEVNRWDLESVYISVMGMLGVEYGILVYRSLNSLKQFRQRMLANDSEEHMEQAFLAQDCLFLTYGSEEDEDEPGLVVDADSQPVFGNLHPLEGIRSFLYDNEAIGLSVILEALHRFTKQHRRKLTPEFPALSSRYKIPVCDPTAAPEATEQTVTVKVATLPEVADELYDMGEGEDFLFPDIPMIRDDLVPENAFLSLGVVPWEMVTQMRSHLDHHQSGQPTEAGEGLPVILIQTSRPKANTMIEKILAAGGIRGICFNPGANPLLGEHYDLGLLQAENHELYLFGVFGEENPTHVQARKKWDQRCKKTRGYCGLVIARGLTGVRRGNPGLKDMVALFEVHAISAADLGLGLLEGQMAID